MNLDAATWNRCAGLRRPFAAWPHPLDSPAKAAVFSGRGTPRLTVVIPTRDGVRHGHLRRLIAQIGRQEFTDFELIVVKGDPRQGRAINIGAELARGEYLLILDDDTALPHPLAFSRLVAAMDADPQIGIAGGSNVLPDRAPALVKRAMREIPRRCWPPVAQITDSDLAEHPCMMLRTGEFKALGGENELLPRGLDPYLRQQYRRAGKRVVIVPGVIYHHLPPLGLVRLWRQFFRNGRQAAYVNRRFPQWVIETPETHGPFAERVDWWERIRRFPRRWLGAVAAGKPVWFLCQSAYSLGFAAGLIVYRDRDVR